jgi:large repetitive protein
MNHLKFIQRATVVVLVLLAGFTSKLSAQTCPTSNEITITVVPDLNITAQPTDLTECVGGTNPISVTVTGGTGTTSYQWQESPNGSTWVDITGATSATYTPTSAASGTTYYHVVITSAGTGCDALISNSSTVVITPDLSISAQPQDITECVGGSTPLNVTVGGATGTIAYQWQESPNGTAWSDISGATSAAYTPDAATAGTKYYRVVVSAGGNGCDAVTSGSATVIITPEVSITAQPVAVTECIGGTNPLSVTVTGATGAITYQWQSSPDGTAWTDVTGATAANYTPSSASAGTTYYHVIISASGNGCDAITSASSTVVITPDLAITAQPANVTECLGGTNPLDVTVTGATGAITYQWQSSPDGSAWTDVTGATAASYVPSSASAGTTYYHVIIKAAGNGCDNITSSSATVIITPDLNLTAQPQDITECVGGTTPLTTTVTGATGTIAYQWQESSNGTTWADITGATSANYTPDASTSGTKYYRVVVSAGGNGCDAVTSGSATVVITPEVSITAQPTNVTECLGGTTPVTVAVTGATGAITYQWQSSPDGTAWTDITGATAASYVPSSASAGTTYYHVIISAGGNGCDAVTSASTTVVITPDLAISAQPTNVTECLGGTNPLSVTVAGATGTIGYQWQSSPDGTAWTDITGATSASYVPSSASAGTTYYHVIISAGGNGCDAVTSASATVIITPDLSLTAQPQDVTECVGGTNPVSVTVAGATGTISYQWQESPNGTTWTDITGATSASYVPDASLAGTKYYRVVVSASGNGCDAVTSGSATVVITPEVSITAQPQDVTECIGGTNALSVSVTGATGTISYQWQSSPDGATGWADITGATAATYTPASTTAGTLYYRVITSASGNGCDAVTSASATVEIKPDLSISAQPQDITECISGDLPLKVTVTGGSGTITYQWQSSPDGTTWTNIGGATADTYVPSSATAGTTQYHVIITSSGTGCDPITSASATVKIEPKPTANITASTTTVCVGGGSVLQATVVGGVDCTIQWQSKVAPADFIDIPGATNTTYTTPAQTVSTGYKVRFVCNGNGCCSK